MPDAAESMLTAHLEEVLPARFQNYPGRGDLTALLLGSVAHKVLHLSRRPVLIAR